MTAIGRFSVASETSWNPSIITFFMQLKGDKHLTAADFVKIWNDREMPQRHPRFHQTVQNHEFLEETGGGGVRDHVHETVYPANRFDLRQRLQAMQLERWDLSDSLWDLKIAWQHHEGTRSDEKRPRWSLEPTSSATTTGTAVADAPEPDADASASHATTILLFRGHHALADGASFGAAMSELFDEAVLLRDLTVAKLREFRKRGRGRSILSKLWRKWVRLVHFLFGSVRALLYQLELFWHLWYDDDPWKQIQQELSNDSSTPSPRTLSWSEVASVDQVKWVAETLGANGEHKSTITINDVFVSCVTAALARQLQHHRERLRDLTGTILPVQRAVHVAVPVHLKGGVVLPNESVGNNIGAFVARVPSEIDEDDDEAARRLRAVSNELRTIKRTPAAFLSHLMAKGLSHASRLILPVSWTSKLYAASNAGSLVVISNNRGSPLPVHLKGRRVESMYGFVPLPPGIPVGVVVMSYAGNINCTVAAEPWAVPDGDQFMVWVLEEYLRLANAAQKKHSQLIANTDNVAL
jgi:WS/DGAT C-terminal domain